MSTDERAANGEFIWAYYDSNFSWMIDNYVSMEIFRLTVCLYAFWLLPMAGYGFYYWYWKSLAVNIWIPPRI